MAVKVGMISLGCSKNQVGGERMLALLGKGGFSICADEALCDAVIVNTCGFIEDAKKESIEQIFEMAALKENGNLRVIAVTGCLAERYREELAREIPEVDVVLGIGSNLEIANAILRALEGEKVLSFGEKESLPLEGERILANPSYYAYLKVAEGCDNCCTYCAIPQIRGRFRSRKMEDILSEAKLLASRGVRELNIVAQDTTRYGQDLYGRLALPGLLQELCKIDGIHWVRLLYCYPERVTQSLLQTMATEPKIVKYMDLPIQHCNGSILKRMNRSGNAASLSSLLGKIRETVPGIVLRTTLITGFPGETEEDFEELCHFVSSTEFERLGCFAYSAEEGTPAAMMEGQLDEQVKRRRADVVMELQMGIAAAFGKSMEGKVLEVLCEGYDREVKLYYGRSYMDAPDIDTKVFFTSGESVEPGSFVKVGIRHAVDYDLFGEACTNEKGAFHELAK